MVSCQSKKAFRLEIGKGRDSDELGEKWGMAMDIRDRDLAMAAKGGDLEGLNRALEMGVR